LLSTGVSTTVNSSQTTGYQTASVVPAGQNEDVQMKMTITNNGNVTLNNLRVYDILPASGDVPGSNGNITFVSLVAAGATPTIRYANGSASTPVYGAHGGGTLPLQTETFQNGSGWGTTNLGTNTKAVYADFGAFALAPGASVEVILTLHVPAAANQTAYNQFSYSVMEAGGSAVLNLNSAVVGFSTQAIMLEYNGNLPSINPINDLTDMPTNTSGIFGAPNNYLTVSAIIPTLSGYTFDSWNTVANGSGATYTGGNNVNFTGGATIPLYAQWTPNTIPVSYNTHGSTSYPVAAFTPAAGSTTAQFGRKIGSTAGSPNASANPGNPSRTGYTFKGWFESEAAALAWSSNTPWDFGADTVTSPGSGSKTMHAAWEAASYTVTYNNESTFTTQPSPKPASYTADSTFPVSIGSPARTGYTFTGWTADYPGASAYDEPTPTLNYAIPAGATGNVILVASFTANTNTAYTVQHYRQKVGSGTNPATDYDLVAADTENKTGTTDQPADATPKGYTGFANAPAMTTYEKTGTPAQNTALPIAGDGSLIVKLYYNRGSSLVSYMYSNTPSPSVAPTLPIPQLRQYGASVTVASAPALTGYTFSGWSTSNATVSGGVFTMPANAVAFTGAWTPLTYTVNYEGNKPVTASGIVTSASGMTSHTATFDQNFPLKPNDFALTGYTFSGWNTSPSGLGTDYANGYTFTPWQLTTNLTLYAKWTADEYGLIFNANGGTPGTTSSKNVTYDAAVGTLPGTGTGAPTRTGYTFLGWSTVSGDSNSVDFTSSYICNWTSPKTVYAVWEALTYTVSYDSNKPVTASGIVTSAGGMTSHTAIYDQNLPLKTNDFVLTGYTFGGWNEAADGSGAGYASGYTFSPWQLTADLTLYAQWTANSYKLIFDANGGTAGATTSMAVTYDTAIGTLPSTGSGAPARTGYTFIGWATTSIAILPDYFGIGNYMTDGDTTLYAVWNANNYTLNFNENGGVPGSITTKAAVYGQQIGTLPGAGSGAPTRTGYTFAGWNTSSSALLPNFNATDYYNTAGNMTVYAVWSAISYTVTFNGNAGSDASLVLPNPVTFAAVYDSIYGARVDEEATRTGYTFNSWNMLVGGAGAAVTSNAPLAPPHDHDIYAQWTANSYKLILDANSGTAGATTSVVVTYDAAVGALPATGDADAPSKTGYTFLGWATTKTAILPNYVGGVYQTDGDTTVYAVWNANKYTLFFSANAADAISGTPSKEVTYNAQVGVLPGVGSGAPTRTGYSFAGWAEANNAGAPDFTALVNYTTAGNKTVFAVWSRNDYTLSFDSQGGSSVASQSVAFEGFGAAPAPPTKYGYNFASWNTAANGSGVLWDFATSSMPAQNLTLYAQWTPKLGTIALTFDPNGGVSGAVSSKLVDFGAAVGALPGVGSGAPTRDHYVFYGWSRTSDAAAADFTSAYVVDFDPGLTVYAVWARDTHTITYFSSGHTAGSIPTQTTHTHGNTVSVKGKGSLVRNHYTFSGWDTSSNATKVVYAAGASLVIENDTNLYAVWKEDPKYSVSYSANGGSNAPTDGNAYYRGDTVTARSPGSLSRSGYTFLGWATGRSGSARYAAGDTFSITGNITLYAVWRQNEQTAPVTPPVTPPATPPVVVTNPGDTTSTVSTNTGGSSANNTSSTGNTLANPASTPAQTDIVPPTVVERIPDETGLDIAEVDGFEDQEVEQFTQQTGNPLTDISDGNVPLGNFLAKGAWSLLSLLLAFVALVITVILIAGTIARRREYDTLSEAARKTARRAAKIGVIAIIAGVLTPVSFFLLDNVNHPMTFVNGNTPIIIALFAVQMTLYALLNLHLEPKGVRKAV
jgi:uncharacterized repeat protein (TIGR02543 family)